MPADGCEYIHTHTLSPVLFPHVKSANATFEDSGKAEQSEYGKKIREWSKKAVLD